MPVEEHIAVQTVVVPSRTITVPPATQVPVMSGVVSVVVLASVGVVMVGGEMTIDEVRVRRTT